jgi:oligopeptide transport system substrate-binding protein
MKIRKGSQFAPDPAFKGKPRELTAMDDAYGLMRILDPAVRSAWLWMPEGRVVGGDEAREKAARTGRFDYDAAIPGLEVVDRDTLRILAAEDTLTGELAARSAVHRSVGALPTEAGAGCAFIP